MSGDDERILLLEEHGFQNSFEFGDFFNRRSRKIISEERCDSHTATELLSIIQEKLDENTWVFYSVYPLDDLVLQDLRQRFNINSGIENNFLLQRDN